MRHGVGECASRTRDRTQPDVDEVRLRRHNEIAGRRCAAEARREEEIFAALAGIVAARADVGQRHFPGVDGAAEERHLAGRRWHLQHHRPAAEVEEGQDVRRLVVRGQELVPGLHHLREVDDVAEVGIEIALQRCRTAAMLAAGIPQMASSMARR